MAFPPSPAPAGWRRCACASAAWPGSCSRCSPRTTSRRCSRSRCLRWAGCLRWARTLARWMCWCGRSRRRRRCSAPTARRSPCTRPPPLSWRRRAWARSTEATWCGCSCRRARPRSSPPRRASSSASVACRPRCSQSPQPTMARWAAVAGSSTPSPPRGPEGNRWLCKSPWLRKCRCPRARRRCKRPPLTTSTSRRCVPTSSRPRAASRSCRRRCCSSKACAAPWP
mmetsp:Transcript_27685/g.73128  ORF Transcript_27685/g.73128 Transcript_27685/m.73128 type:complete len:226 (-) Transcript_27685:44-721(-)